MPTIHDLLAKGYFPRELPPAFTTLNFANVVAGDAAFLAGKPQSAHLCVHNMVRSGGLRRNLSVPNPVQYARLCDFVVSNWNQLQAAAQKSPYSLTKPIDTKLERAISGQFDLDARTAKRVEIRSRARFVLHTDVNRFYSSIYTHSIPWAIHGKSIVKDAKATKTLASLWSDKLDTLIRNLNDQQTMGLPIGPDISLLLAEVVLGAVDEKLAAKFPGLRAMRFIDDYEFAFNQRSEAERVVSELQAILSHYELALNPSKTRIIELPDSVESLWTSKLRTFLFRDAGIKVQRNDLTAYFDSVFTLSKNEPNEGIFKFAIPRLNSVTVVEANWSILQNLLAQCATIEPACLPQVCEQMVHYKVLNRVVDLNLWSECLNQIIIERLPLGQASEAVWALWLMKYLAVAMTPAAEEAVNNCEDSATALLGLGLASNGLAKQAAFNRLNAFAEPDELFGPQWLLCYEGVRRGWITAPSGLDALAATPQFAFLNAQGVSFFNLNAAAAPPRRGGAGAIGGGGAYPI